jgi:hypothetical protein
MTPETRATLATYRQWYENGLITATERYRWSFAAVRNLACWTYPTH